MKVNFIIFKKFFFRWIRNSGRAGEMKEEKDLVLWKLKFFLDLILSDKQ